VAAGAGALAGGLIGSGIGAAAVLTGAQASVAVGAGMGLAGAALSDHLSNIANGQNFVAAEHATTSAFGLVSGAVSMAPALTLGGRVAYGATLGLMETITMAGVRGESTISHGDMLSGTIRGAGAMILGEAIAIPFTAQGATRVVPGEGLATTTSTLMTNALWDPSTNWGYDPEYTPACYGRPCGAQ